MSEMPKDEEDALYQSCHEVIDGLLVVSGDRILSAIRAAYAKGREDERGRCAKVCEEIANSEYFQVEDYVMGQHRACIECAAAIRRGE